MLLVYIHSVGLTCQCLKILLFLLSFLLEITYSLCKSILSYEKSLESLSVQPKQRTTGRNDFRALPVVHWSFLACVVSPSPLTCVSSVMLCQSVSALRPWQVTPRCCAFPPLCPACFCACAVGYLLLRALQVAPPAAPFTLLLSCLKPHVTWETSW